MRNRINPPESPSALSPLLLRKGGQRHRAAQVRAAGLDGGEPAAFEHGAQAADGGLDFGKFWHVRKIMHLMLAPNPLMLRRG